MRRPRGPRLHARHPNPAHAAAEGSPRPPSRIAVAARSVPWTVWVALAGALLVVAAAAGFAIYAWPSLAAGIRLGILVAVTAAFYGGGLWLRRRLAVIGISLLAVGAALVLVDGWLLLSAAGLHSLWWWTLLFAVGSAVHWGMGVWLRVEALRRQRGHRPDRVVVVARHRTLLAARCPGRHPDDRGPHLDAGRASCAARRG